MTSMSYVVLARKYRPRNFAQMAGQEHVVRALSNALTQQRLHHAYLFTGTRGIGKTTVSRILARRSAGETTGSPSSTSIPGRPAPMPISKRPSVSTEFRKNLKFFGEYNLK